MDDKSRYLKLAKARFKESLGEREVYEVEVTGKKFLVYPGVFSPKYFIDTEFFVLNVPVQKGETFLEIGCGTGVISVLVAQQGADVTATDINPVAVQNTKENAARYGVNEQMTVLLGNLFGPVAGNKYDSIFWNMPFNRTQDKSPSIEELAIVDPGDRFKTEFIQKARLHLKPNGRLLLGFSSNYGNSELLEKLLDENGFAWRILAEKEADFNSDVMRLELIEARPGEGS